MPAEIAALRDGAEPVWMFAYGSLLWDGELCNAAAEPALLLGYHRSFCLYSYDYRGTPSNPGLTLGLDRGGSCRGAVLRLSTDALDRVWHREMSGRLVYAAIHDSFVTADDALHAPIFLDHAGNANDPHVVHCRIAANALANFLAVDIGQHYVEHD